MQVFPSLSSIRFESNIHIAFIAHTPRVRNLHNSVSPLPHRFSQIIKELRLVLQDAFLAIELAFKTEFAIAARLVEARLHQIADHAAEETGYDGGGDRRLGLRQSKQPWI